jgi:hypothetical protein
MTDAADIIGIECAVCHQEAFRLAPRQATFVARRRTVTRTWRLCFIIERNGIKSTFKDICSDCVPTLENSSFQPQNSY